MLIYIVLSLIWLAWLYKSEEFFRNRKPKSNDFRHEDIIGGLLVIALITIVILES